MIAVIDYGMGNIHSVNKALNTCGAQTLITDDPEKIANCEKIVLPGVGAFSDAMQELKRRSLVEAILNHIKNKKQFLGICLGMQLLFENSEEAEGCNGLSVLKGKVRRFSRERNLKVPHMGWNEINPAGKSLLFKDIPAGSFVYFCHSYYPDPLDDSVKAAVCDYGVRFAAAVASNNVYGVQFHPEKSQNIGLKIIDNFVKLC
jgi:glutamine amidotransferase